MRSVWSGCGTTSDFETLCTMWGIFYAASYSWRRIRVISRVQVTSTAHMFCRRKQDVCASSLQSVLMHHWREAGNESVDVDVEYCGHCSLVPWRWISPGHGLSLQMRTVSGFSPSHSPMVLSLALQTTCLCWIPSSQVTEHWNRQKRTR